jgi:creatinine amidohydrolase
VPEDGETAPEPQRLLLHEITRGEAAARAPRALLLLPVGATEQHGPHLPLGTDFLAVEHVARDAAAIARRDIDILVAPTLAVGSSHHHLPFGGTISMATERYYGALRDIVESLIVSGFRRLFILNGHGGNHELIQLVARDLVLCHPVSVAAASYWDVARAALVEREPELAGLIPGHAGVFETSLILALRPDLVAAPISERSEAERERAGIPAFPFRAERAGWWTGLDGFTDGPHRASAERGQRLLAVIEPAVAAALVQFAALPLLADPAGG